MRCQKWQLGEAALASRQRGRDATTVFMRATASCRSSRIKRPSTVLRDPWERRRLHDDMERERSLSEAEDLVLMSELHGGYSDN